MNLKNHALSSAAALALVGLALAATPTRADGPRPDPKSRPRPNVHLDEKCTGRGFSETRRTYLGVESNSLTPELRRHFKVDGDSGVLISRVMEDSPAAEGGLQVGDVLVALDGNGVRDPHKLGSLLRAQTSGEQVALTVVRDGRRETLRVKLGSRRSCEVELGELVALEGLGRLEKLERLGDLGELEALRDLNIEIGDIDVDAIIRATLATAAAGIHGALDSDEWRDELKRLKDIDLDKLEDRMQEVQRELERLEEKLENESGEYRDRARAQVDAARQRIAREREQLERELERAQEQVERAHEKAQDQLERAQEKAREDRERQREREERQREKRGGGGVSM